MDRTTVKQAETEKTKRDVGGAAVGTHPRQQSLIGSIVLDAGNIEMIKTKITPLKTTLFSIV